jgi:hypothetical protein
VTQLFSSRFGFFLRLGLIAALGLAIIAVFAWRGVMAGPAAVNEPLEQPVPFSHKHHVGDDGIDCRYCHSSVESSAFAGIPPLSTCMTCHSQLYTDQPALAPVVNAFERNMPLHWQRVHHLPDFVYFNHSIHIAKGVGCASCHGEIDRMALTSKAKSLTMGFCLDCHRDPGPRLRPESEIFNTSWQRDATTPSPGDLMRHYHVGGRRLDDCSICHR